ncbi:complex I assembly factor ACAD9, mitochondrial [Drosophila grimshawi]|uniref:GH20496 n=1 Tax=Drosophila grimshawi TaxID=7222 RepID=B4J908_DROGR|nr:complex I assembly factor ACAD9, mitochondrial [Drosophila grimshawi]EDW01357.1 GH20496 [Drosophila grimshawi]
MRYNLISRAVRLLNQSHNQRGNYLLKRVASSSSSSSSGSLNQRDEQPQATEATTEASQSELPAREPLVKNFFVGITDKELLGYPEVIAREEMSQLKTALLPLNNYFAEQQSQSQSQLESLTQLGLYGLNVPLEYDGKGYNWSASLMASESEAGHTSLALGLQSHRIVVDMLRELGSEEQKQRYLPSLATGQVIATDAIFEYTPPEDDFFGTQAIYDTVTGSWTLSGEKAFVVTAPVGTRQLFLVLAQTQQLNVPGNIGMGSTFFLVDSQQQGVKLGELHATFGCREAPMRRLHFDKVQLRQDQILGSAHEGNRHAEHLVRSSRLRTTQSGIALAKRLLQQLTAFSVDTTQCGVQIKDLELTRANLSQAMCSIYAMESMLYLSAGLLDEFLGQDVTLESAITKYYTLQQLHAIATQSLGLLGPRSLHQGEPAEMALRDTAQLCTQGESLSTLSMFIALTGLQHAGQRMNEGVRKSRNPLFHPGHIFGKFMGRSSLESPKTGMLLAENVHPTLEPAAQCIEHSIARLHMAVDLMFTRHGNAVVERQIELQRVANIASIIYAMWASAARASRSYCIGLPLADHELLTASAICTQGRDDVLRLATDVFNGNYVNNDNNLLRLSTQVAKSKGYFAVHPLTFNF